MTDPPIEGIAGALVARLSGRPFVYNIRDMYPDMAVGGSIVRPGSFTARWEAMHRWALRRAARVIVLGEDMRDRIIGEGSRSWPHRDLARWHHDSGNFAVSRIIPWRARFAAISVSFWYMPGIWVSTARGKRSFRLFECSKMKAWVWYSLARAR